MRVYCHRIKMFFFICGCTLRSDVFLVVRRVLHAKVVGASSSEGFLDGHMVDVMSLT